MFDKFSDAAEKLATSVSRRVFLGRLGQGALGSAGVLGAIFAYPGFARARGGNSYTCCEYRTWSTQLQRYMYCVACVPPHTHCPTDGSVCAGDAFVTSWSVADCTSCKLL